MSRILASSRRRSIAVVAVALVAFAAGLGARRISQIRLARFQERQQVLLRPQTATPKPPPESTVSSEPAEVMEAGHAAVPEVHSFPEALNLARRYSEELDAPTSDQTGAAAALTEVARVLRVMAGRDTVNIPSAARESVRELGAGLIQAGADFYNARPTERQPHRARIRELISSLVAAVPDRWICPTRCEGPGITHDAPGACPVCGAALSRVGELPYSARITDASTGLEPVIWPGEPVDLRIELLDPIGRPVSRLATVHEATLHLLSVSSDLSWYAHDHPTPVDGEAFLIRHRFPFPGRYTLFHDFTPQGLGQQVARVILQVRGEPPAAIPLIDSTESVLKLDDYEVRIRCNAGKFTAGSDAIIRYGLSRWDTGRQTMRPVTDLEPYLGAMGHLVIISEDLGEFVHSHPVSADAGAAGHAHPGRQGLSDAQIIDKARALANGADSDVIFHTVFPRAVTYRAFAQFKHQGRVLTAPFTIAVEPSDAPAAAPNPHQGH